MQFNFRPTFPGAQSYISDTLIDNVLAVFDIWIRFTMIMNSVGLSDGITNMVVFGWKSEINCICLFTAIELYIEDIPSLLTA